VLSRTGIRKRPMILQVGFLVKTDTHFYSWLKSIKNIIKFHFENENDRNMSVKFD
jgi:hypothetical protein